MVLLYLMMTFRVATLLVAFPLLVATSWTAQTPLDGIPEPNIATNNGTIMLSGSDVFFNINATNVSMQNVVAVLASHASLLEQASAMTASSEATLLEDIQTRFSNESATASSAIDSWLSTLAAATQSLSSAVAATSVQASTQAAQLQSSSSTVQVFGEASVAALSQALGAAVMQLNDNVAVLAGHNTTMTQLSSAIGTAQTQLQTSIFQISSTAVQNTLSITAASLSTASISSSVVATFAVASALNASLLSQNTQLSLAISAAQNLVQQQISQTASTVAGTSAAVGQASASTASISAAVVIANGVLVSHNTSITTLTATAGLISASAVAVQNQASQQVLQLALNGTTWSTAIVFGAVSAAAISTTVVAVSTGVASLSTQLANVSFNLTAAQSGLVIQLSQAILSLNATSSALAAAELSVAALSNAAVGITQNAVGLSTAVASSAVIGSQISSSVSAANAFVVSQLSTMMSTITAQLGTKVATASLLSIFNNGLFSSVSAVPYPSAISGMSGTCVLWLDAMLPDCVNYNNANQIQSADGTNNYAFAWNAINSGAPMLRNGAWMLWGQGYYSNTAGCPNFPTGGNARTMMAWARPSSSNHYLKHVFHYGNSNTANAFGITQWLSSNPPQTLSTGTLDIHQWGWVGIATSTWANATWTYGQALFVAISLNNNVYSFSINGGPLLAFTAPSNSPNTMINGVSGYCNLGSRVNPDEYWTGQISSVYMYNAALSQAQINTVYQATLRTF